MNLNDLATKDYIFQAESEKRGILTCRHCETHVIVEIKTISFLIFATSKIKVIGKWCKCSDLTEILGSLVGQNA